MGILEWADTAMGDEYIEELNDHSTEAEVREYRIRWARLKRDAARSEMLTHENQLQMWYLDAKTQGRHEERRQIEQSLQQTSIHG